MGKFMSPLHSMADINFRYENINLIYYFSHRDWSTVNVTTLITNDSRVRCETRHLTSFAVLVQLTGTTIVRYCILRMK